MPRSPVVLLVAAALSGCMTPGYDRTGYVLESEGGLRWSNSPVVLEERQPELEDDRLGVTYSVVLENTSAVPVDLLLSRSVASMGGDLRTASSECRVLRAARASDVRLPAGQRTRIDCRLRLTLRGMNRLALRDSVLTLVIPAVHGTAPLALGFAFQLKREDRR